MKFLSNLLVLLVVASCGYDVGNTIPPCDPDPVAYEIIWKMKNKTEEGIGSIKLGDTVRWIEGEEDMEDNVGSEDRSVADDFGSDFMIGMGFVYEYVFLQETVFD